MTLKIYNKEDDSIPLTRRQRKVMALRALDKTWEQIATQLKITVSRAKICHANARRKIDQALR